MIERQQRYRYLRSVVPTMELAVEDGTETGAIIGTPPRDCGFMVEATVFCPVEAR